MCVLDNTAQRLGQEKKQAHREESWHGAWRKAAGSKQQAAGRYLTRHELVVTRHQGRIARRTKRIAMRHVAWRKKREGM